MRKNRTFVSDLALGHEVSDECLQLAVGGTQVSPYVTATQRVRATTLSDGSVTSDFKSDLD